MGLRSISATFSLLDLETAWKREGEIWTRRVFVCSGRGLHSCSPLAATDAPGTNLCSNNVHVMDLLFGIPRSLSWGIILKFVFGWMKHKSTCSETHVRFYCFLDFVVPWARILARCVCFWLFSSLLRPENILTHWVQSSIVYTGVFVIRIWKKFLNPTVTLCFF